MKLVTSERLTYFWGKLKTLLDGKVDKVEGYRLTEQNFTTGEKNKLNSIAAGAEVNVQADWTEDDEDSDAFINNKPALSAVAESGQFADIAGKPTTVEGYGIEDAYTKEQVDAKVASVYRYRGSVATYDDLPIEDLVVGDVYNLEDTGDNYAWAGEGEGENGDGWDKLSSTVDLTPYATKNELNEALENFEGGSGDIDVASIMNSAGQNGQLFGLGGECINISSSDLNSIQLKTGFYMGDNLTNAPLAAETGAGGWWYIEQLVHNDNYIRQMAYRFTGAECYTRIKNGGSWNDWCRIIDSSMYNIHSKAEHVVGTWINGKPLYERAFTANDLTSNIEYKLPHLIQNAERVWIANDSFFYRGDKPEESYSIPHIAPGANYSKGYIISGVVDLTNVILYWGSLLATSGAKGNFVVILHYTKTTD